MARDNPTTLIIGGGLAGMAAAVGLAARGMSVTLLESRPRLGGRASSFVDRTTGDRIDNCQHVSMGCCTNFRHFCETTGLALHLRTERELYFIGPDGLVNRFSAAAWPVPLHLWPAFRRLSYLSRGDLHAISRGLRALARSRPAPDEARSFDEWLREQRQPAAAIERFWHVVLVSALSESLDRIDVANARKVFVDAFLANRRGWEVQIPTVPLDDLYGGALVEWLARHGVTVRLQSGVARLVAEDGAVTAVELRSGERLSADHYVLAVPHHLVLSLLPEGLRTHPPLAALSGLESAPITSVHLWFDRPVTDLPHAVFVGRLSHWMFNRSWKSVVRGPSSVASGVTPASQEATRAATAHGPRPADGFYYQVVISASRHLAGRPQEETIAEVVRELTEVWPTTAQAQLVHARMVMEHKAVFSVKPGADALRPPQQSPLDNLQFAGDWTKTGWPATMEGAVRSGYLAAENVLARAGRPERLLQPDLPAGVLARILFGL